MNHERTMESNSLIADLQHEFHQYRQMAERAMGQLDDEAFFRRIGEQVNPVALIVKHLAGNLLSRWTDFLTTDGDKPSRNRDNEFVISPDDTRSRLMEALASRLERRGEHASIAPGFRSSKNHHHPRRAAYGSTSAVARIKPRGVSHRANSVPGSVSQARCNVANDCARAKQESPAGYRSR